MVRPLRNRGNSSRIVESKHQELAMRQAIPLEQVRIDQPCEMPWDEMRGNDRARFCEKCQLHVHNLSAMTSNDAAALVDGRTDRMCVAYMPTAQGAPITLDYE